MSPVTGVAQNRNTTIPMITLTELLIVLLGFALPAGYLFIVNRFIKEAERTTAELDAREQQLSRAA